MAEEALAVHIAGRFAGMIERQARSLRLSYADDYAHSPEAVGLSLSLPLRGQAITGARVAGWLDGLLPADGAVRRRWAAKQDSASTEAFDLLSTPIGLDCPGAVQFCPAGESAAVRSWRGGVEWLSPTQLEGLVEEMVRDRVWERTGSGYAFSLGGAQSKTALFREGGRWGEPWGATPSTHILKPSMPDLRDQAINEHLCLAAVRHCGLVAAGSQALLIGGHAVVAVRRSDRLVVPEGVRRVHQEDMHQACGDPSEPIYQSETGGHSIKRLARLLHDHSMDRDTDLEMFFDALAFNWVVCNTDAHSKNYSLLLSPNGVRLAPLYDIWSLLPYEPDLAPSYSMAMAALDDRRILAADNPSAWMATAEAVGIRSGDGPLRAAAVAEAVPQAFEQAVDELADDVRSSPLAAELTSLVRDRARHCLNSLATG